MQHPGYSFAVAPIIYAFISLLYKNTELYNNLDSVPDRYQATYYDHADTFDFIVVGSGSAGAIVANRLSKYYQVLLLEAGGEQQPGTAIPSTALVLLNRPYVDWSHITVPQTNACFALKDRRAGWSAGKGLGGTSVINFMIYLRGHVKDYENWANITGDWSWSYDELLPHFKAIENYHGEWDNDELHGHHGEIPVQIPPYTGMAEIFVRAGEELGYPRVDLNGKYKDGFSVIYNNIDNGRRVSTNKAFIEPLRKKPSNLTLYKFAQVNKILFRNFNEAYGVEYIRHGMKKIAYAKKEIIISAGTVNSAKLLMLSGIGPRDHLHSLGIDTVSDLPVGKTVQDHISVYLGPIFVNDSITMILDRDVNSEAFTEFISKGTGTLSSTGTLAAGYLSSTLGKLSGEDDWPDLQYILLGTGVHSRMDTDFAEAFHVDEEILKKYFAHAKNKDSFQIITSLARPRQKGEILLSSSDPNAEPIIDPKYLQDDHDSEVLIDGIERAIYLVENTTTFQKYGARFTDQVFPGCESVPFRSQSYWDCYMRHYSITLHHMVGSCPMGKPDSKDAVVDSKLRVIGTKFLRVIDGSVMPAVPISNTNCPAMTIGEKGAHMILTEWKGSPSLNSVSDKLVFRVNNKLK